MFPEAEGPMPQASVAVSQQVVRKGFLTRFSIEFWMTLAALLVRVSFLWLPKANDDVSWINEISNIAVSLAGGHGFASPFPSNVSTGPTAWIPPLYPFLCSLIFRVTGGYSTAAVQAICVLNGLFSALTCIPLYWAAKKIFDRRVALVAGWTFALCPYFAKWSVTWVWETTLSALFMTWMFWAILKIQQEDTLRNWIIYGCVWGAAMLNNPSVLTLVAFSILWFLEWGGRKSWRHILAAVLVCMVVISPWIARNRIVMHRWIFIRSNFGFEFHLGNFPGSKGDCWMDRHPWGNEKELEVYRSEGEVEYVAEHGKEAKQFIAENPGEFVRLCWHRFLNFWNGGAMRMRPRWRALWLPWLYLPLTITTAAGLFLMLKRRLMVANLMFLAIVVYPWPYYIACIQTRFRHVIDPLMLMVSVYFLAEVFRGLRRVAQQAFVNRSEKPAEGSSDSNSQG